jgi:hypothetical protein
MKFSLVRRRGGETLLTVVVSRFESRHVILLSMKVAILQI